MIMVSFIDRHSNRGWDCFHLPLVFKVARRFLRSWIEFAECELIVLPGVPEIGVCFLYCFPFHYQKSYWIETLYGWRGCKQLVYNTISIWYVYVILHDTVSSSAWNKSRILGLILNAGGKIYILMRRNIEEGLKYFSHAHKM